MRTDDDHLDDVRLALAEALGERKVRLTDRRLLILYGLVVALLAGLLILFVQSNEDRKKFEREVTANCHLNRQNTIAFNAFIDKLITSYNASPTVSEKDRQLRIEFFRTAKQVVPSCPPQRGLGDGG